MKLEELFSWGREQLREAKVPDWELDARYLLLEAFHLNLASFLTVRFQEIPQEQSREKERYQEMIRQRRRRIPLQQILGVQEFMGLEFQVNSHVLIPRQDTETLTELVLEECPDPSLSLLDVCTGSGCIAVSLAKLGGYSQVTALDLSREALETAGENARRLLSDYRGSFRLIESDMMRALGPEETFDVIVSNPPYIPTQVIEGLEPEVRDHEPRMALDGSEDGLAFYRILAGESPSHLKPGGRIYLEIGWDQGQAVFGLLERAGFDQVRILPDLAGNDRVAAALWPGKQGKPTKQEV